MVLVGSHRLIYCRCRAQLSLADLKPYSNITFQNMAIAYILWAILVFLFLLHMSETYLDIF